MVAPRKTPSFVDELLAEQQLLQTLVVRAAEAFQSKLQNPKSEFAQLIPLSRPQPGEQYAFEVDLDACTGCKACVSACHALNGLDDTETWRDVGLLVGGDRRRPFQQTVTTACHHCADPACLNGCPVLAYEKDPVTGIVRHLDDQCIGCSYCILKCPYDVPKFNDRLGIVRKCDMCHGRLAEGEAPACAQACPTHAIRIVTVAVGDPVRIADCGLRTGEEETPFRPDALATATSETQSKVQNSKSEIHSALRTPHSAFPSAAPDPSYTRPTTRYVTRRPAVLALAAADAAALRPQPPHWPLVVLLTLMPMAVGCGIADKVLSLPNAALAVAGWGAGAVGLALSVLHLGRPLRAWRVFLGLRKSWLSREAVVFGAWFPLASAYAAARVGWLPVLSQSNGLLHSALAVTTATFGVLGLFCSVMLYADTRRVFWRFASTAPRFFGSGAVLGLATALAMPGAPRGLTPALMAAMLVKLAFELRALRPLGDRDDPPTPERQTARLLAGPLRPVNGLRLLLGLAGGVFLPFAIFTHAAPAPAAWAALALVLAGELAERYLFFRAVDAPKMPGLPAVVSAKAGVPA